MPDQKSLSVFLPVNEHERCQCVTSHSLKEVAVHGSSFCPVDGQLAFHRLMMQLGQIHVWQPCCGLTLSVIFLLLSNTNGISFSL